MAIHTTVLFCDLREIITLEIERRGHPEHIAWTIFDTEFAALAPFFDYRYLTSGNPYGFQVKWNPPIFHSEIPLVLQIEKSFSRNRLGEKTRKASKTRTAWRLTPILG
jgi:hypothetical protein